MTGRLIIAPVGLQPVAVLAPLRSPPLRPDSGDQVLLVASPESLAAAERIQRLLDPGHRAEWTILRAEGGWLPDEVLSTVEKRVLSASQEAGEVGLLTNGGDGIWLHQLVDLLLRMPGSDTDRVWLASSPSKQTVGSLFGLGGGTRSFDLAPVPVEELLSFLDLRLREGRLERVGRPGLPELFIPGVDRLVAEQGSLYAVVNTALWGQQRESLNQYRNLLRYGFLQEFGLERRRLLLLLPEGDAGNRLERRARRDGFPTCREAESGLQDLVAQPSAQKGWAVAPLPSLPKQCFPRTRSLHKRTFVAILGTNVGPVIQALASHGRGQAVLLCDETSGEVLANARRIARLHRTVFPDYGITFLPMGGLGAGRAGIRGALKGLPEDSPLDVNLTPGEKLRRLFLQLETKPLKGSRHWMLDGASVRRLGDSARFSSHVPLLTWVQFHTDQAVSVKESCWSLENGPPEVLMGLAQGVRRHLCATRDLTFLNGLWNRPKGELRLSLGKEGRLLTEAGRPDQWQAPYPGILEVPGAGTYSLNEMAGYLGCGDLPKDFLPPGRAEGGGAVQGRWFEWVVAILLAGAGVEEVQRSTIIGQDRNRFSDEMDVLTRHEGAYTLWSCKTKAEPAFVSKEAREAAGVASRFLGPSASAVVVVPKIRRPSGLWVPISEGRWRVHERAEVVDLTLWNTAKAVLDLATRGAGRSRAPSPPRGV